MSVVYYNQVLDTGENETCFVHTSEEMKPIGTAVHLLANTAVTG
jgi:hypothetical protein